jgi:LacI family transcriptional regulator
MIETSSGYGRDVLRGIMRYIRSHEEWTVFLEHRALTSELPRWLADWHGDGVISRSPTSWLWETARRNGVPLVNLVDRRELRTAPSVFSDQEAIGRVGAEHLLERGFSRFGFCGFADENWSDGRGRGFIERLRSASCAVEVYESAWMGPDVRAWDEEQRALCAWVGGLPKPCGILACNDLRARQVLEACRLCGLAVPEEVAVLGVDNDELLCQLCHPPLSSVIPDTEQIGYQAAELLARMMRGEEVNSSLLRLPPLGVATRQSTDSLAISDPQIAAAARFIREGACRGVSVGDVVRHVSLSRSALERGFRKYLRRSPQQEIRHVQLKRCKDLLAETDLPMERIAQLCGFRHPEYMHVVFKRTFHTTPGAFRKVVRGGKGGGGGTSRA